MISPLITHAGAKKNRILNLFPVFHHIPVGKPAAGHGFFLGNVPTLAI
jgi:hypothetical protein